VCAAPLTGDVDADVGVQAVGVGLVELGHHVGGVLAAVGGQHARDRLERLAELHRESQCGSNIKEGGGK
jgi:hypothetical protein